MSELQFEELYHLSMRCLRFNRAHPSVPLDRRWVLIVGFMHGHFTLALFSFLYSLIAVDLKRRDFSRACANGIFITVWWVVTVMYAVMLHYRDILIELIRINQEHFDAAAALPAAAQAVVRSYAERGRWVSKLWFWSCVINCGLFPLKAFSLTLYSLYQGDFHLVPWFDSSWPSPIEEHKYEPLTFSIIFYLHIVFGVYAIWMYIGFSPLGPIFILNACARLDLMITEVKAVFNVEPYNKKDASEKIAQIVKKIQDMYSYVALINDMFRVLYEFNMKGSAMMIPIAFYQVVDASKRGEFDIEYPTFILTAALLCYVPCYYSDLLMAKGEELRVAIYESGWEAHNDLAARSSVLIMLTAAVRPISISSIFTTMCLDAFAGLCHDAYAIFSLINAMWN